MKVSDRKIWGYSKGPLEVSPEEIEQIYKSEPTVPKTYSLGESLVVSLGDKEFTVNDTPIIDDNKGLPIRYYDTLKFRQSIAIAKHTDATTEELAIELCYGNPDWENRPEAEPNNTIKWVEKILKKRETFK
jgi:hypothetical protein